MRANDEKATVDYSVSLMLRGIAILIVVFSHYTEWMYLPSPFPGITEYLCTLGPVGVDVFLVLSGYGLYMSAVSKNVSGSPGIRFLIKRLSNVYVPYLIIAVVINVLFGGGSMFRDHIVFVNILTGGDYWYIRVLLLFYIFFMLAFTVFKKLRLVALGIMVIAYTVFLHRSGYRDFWTLSNLAFLIGSCTAAFSKNFTQLWNKKSLRITVTLISLAITVTFYMLMMYYGESGKPSVYRYEFNANLFFSVSVIFAASLIKKRKYTVLRALGESSLFQYLLHPILFCNAIEWFERGGYILSFILSALFVMIVSVAVYKIYRLFVLKLVKPVFEKNGYGERRVK